MSDPDLAVVTGDVLDLDSVRAAMLGCNAVVVALGRGTSGQPHLYETGIANVVHAMAESMVSRLSVMSAGGTFARTDKRLSLAFRAQIATTLRATYDDLEAMERRVMASDLDWTIVRPSGLTDIEASGHYRLSLDGVLMPKMKRISRADVASLLVKAIETDTYWRRTVVISE